MKFTDYKDISIGIQCLKRITERNYRDEKVKRTIVPALNRVIMEMEHLIESDMADRQFKELSK